MVSTWTELNPPSGFNPEMVYDAADGYVLLLGGLTGASADPTWIFVRDHWSELHVGRSPPSNAWASMAYDPADREVVLFGGVAGGYSVYSAPYFSDTWTYRGGHWTLLNFSSTPHPSARAYASFAYDSTDGYLVLFGGTNLHCTYLGCFGRNALGDTWSFSHGVWTLMPPGAGGAPSPRLNAAAAGYQGGVILVGGEPGFVWCYCFQDTWRFASGAWTNITSGAGSPPALEGATLVNDTVTGSCVMFGGLQGRGLLPSNQTWTYNGSWHNATRTTAPPGGGRVPMTFDPHLRSVIAFGVAPWVWANGNWAQLPPYQLPNASDQPLLAYDNRDGYVVLFEGDSGTTWKFSGGQWTELLPSSTSTPPPWTIGASLVYDATDGYAVLFRATYGNQTWTYSAGAWTQVLSGPAPSARLNAALSYDTADGYVVLFGGSLCNPTYWYTGCQEFNDTWKFVGGAWSQILPSTSPPARHAASMVDDPAAGSVVLFGGIRCLFVVPGCTTLNDTWTYRAGAWTNLSLPARPPARGGASLTYDPGVLSVVLFGGGLVGAYGSWTGFLGDTWVFHAGAWTHVSFGGQFTPVDRVQAGFVHLPGSQQDLLFGGNLYNDTWYLALA